MAVTINGDGVVDVGGNASSAAYVRLYEDSDNGTNYVDLIAPASVASNRTLTMPDASGTIDRLNRAGNVLQVVQGTSSTDVNISSATYTDMGLSVSITPSSASSKVLVFATNMLIQKTGGSGGGPFAALKLVRNSTDLIIIADQLLYSGSTLEQNGSISCGYLDSPATTSATTYKIQFRNPPATGTISYRGGSNATITAMEIAG